MNTLYFFTASYPFGMHETFIESEIDFLAKDFDKVIIYPFFYSDKVTTCRETPSNVQVYKPVIPLSLSRRILLTTISLSPIIPFLREFFKFKVYKKKKTFIRWIINFTDSRIALKSKEFKQLNKVSSGVCYFYWGMGWACVLPFINKNKNLQYIIRIHGGDAYLERADGYLPFRPKIYEISDKILTISNDAKEYLIHNYFIEPSKIETARLGTKFISMNPFILSDTTTIVTCASVIPVKRINLLIEILQKINNLKINWHHFGDGIEYLQLKEQSKQLPQNIKCNFHGRVNNKEVLAFYKTNSVDLFINLSKYEGIPVSIMEAMSFGIPSMATDAGATREIVNNLNGFLLPVNFDLNDARNIILNVGKGKFLAKRKEAFKTWSDYYNSEVVYDSHLKGLI